MSTPSKSQTPKNKVKNNRKPKGKPVVTSKRKGHLNLSVSEQARTILLKCEKVSGYSKSVLVQMACVEYLAPKWLL